MQVILGIHLSSKDYQERLICIQLEAKKIRLAISQLITHANGVLTFLMQLISILRYGY